MTRREAERLQRLLAEASPADADPGAAPDGAAVDESGRELAGLVSLARTLESSAAEPAPALPDALRERVLATAAEEPPSTWRARVGSVADDLAAAWRLSTRSPLASGAVTVVLLLAGLFAGASLSLPGDPLYAIKDAYQQAQLARASAPADVASIKLDMASAKIDETVRAADRDRPHSLAMSAHDADVLVRDSAETLLTAFHDTGDSDLLVPLATFVDDHRPIVSGVRDRVADPETERALAELMATLDSVDAEVADILGRCCEPTSDAGTYWLISSPEPVLGQWPGPGDGGDASEPGEGSNAAGNDRIDLLPRLNSADDTPAQQWRQRLRQGVDQTREHVDDTTDQLTDGVDQATEDTTDAVDDTTDDVTDAVDETTDDATDAVDDTTGGATDGVTEDLDDAVDQSTDAVDDTLDRATDGATDAVDDTTDAVDDAVGGALGEGASSHSSDGGAGGGQDAGSQDGTTRDDGPDGGDGLPDAVLDGSDDEAGTGTSGDGDDDSPPSDDGGLLP